MDRKKVKGEIQTYSKRARNQLFDIVEKIFTEHGIKQHVDDTYACIDELVKNAVKANYKYVLIWDKICEKIAGENPDISNDKVVEMINELLKKKDEYDNLAENISEEEKISKKVRQILNQESVFLKIKNKVFDQDRDYTDDEKEIISKLNDLNDIKKKLSDRNIRVIIKYESDDEFIFVEVTNTAPIMGSDVQRIHEKRDEFKICRQEGNEHEFFIKNLDTSDSGFGLGYATIDSFLGNMGLDPYKSIQLISAVDTTVIISFKISELTK